MKRALGFVMLVALFFILFFFIAYVTSLGSALITFGIFLGPPAFFAALYVAINLIQPKD